MDMLTRLQNLAYIGCALIVIEGVFFSSFVSQTVERFLTILLIVFLIVIPVISYIKWKKKQKQ